jgi:integrase/recombinase XerC
MNSATGPLAEQASSSSNSLPSGTGQTLGAIGNSDGVKTEKSFSPLVKQFLDYLHLEKHFSDYTVKSYGADLIQFGQFLMGQIGQTHRTTPSPAGSSLDDRQVACDAITIREFLAYLYAQNYTKSTTARKLATLRSFFKFLMRRGQVSVNPLSTIRIPKQEKRLPKCLDLE